MFHLRRGHGSWSTGCDFLVPWAACFPVWCVGDSWIQRSDSRQSAPFPCSDHYGLRLWTSCCCPSWPSCSSRPSRPTCSGFPSVSLCCVNRDHLKAYLHQSNPLSRFVSATSVEPVGTPPVSISTAPVPAPTAPAPVPTAPVPVPVAPFGGGGKGRRMMERNSGKKGGKKATKKGEKEQGGRIKGCSQAQEGRDLSV